jgi:hypothetical protein
VPRPGEPSFPFDEAGAEAVLSYWTEHVSALRERLLAAEKEFRVLLGSELSPPSR